QRKLQDAEACYRRALAGEPKKGDAPKKLCLLIVGSGGFEENFSLFRGHAQLAYGKPGGAGQTPTHKAQPEPEQREHLVQIAGAAAPTFRLEEGGRVPGRAVNPDTSDGEIAQRWRTSSPQIAVIDNLLTAEGLAALRDYCWRSTMWNKSYPNGYLGAMP